MAKVLASIISLVTAGYIVFTLNISGSLEVLSFGNKALGGLILFIIFFCLSFIIIKKLLGKGNYKSLKTWGGVFFIAFFTIFLLGCISGMDMVEDISVLENRALRKFPRISPFHEAFPGKFNDFVDDRVGFRIQASNVYKKISPYLFDDINISRGALVGRDHWLFLNEENDAVQNYQRILEYNKDQYAELKKHIENVKTFCDANGIKFYFMVPPNKSTVYPEFYPEFIKHLNRPSQYDLLRNYFKNNMDVPFIDIYDNILKEKNDYTLYYKDDTHWNSTAAYFAYKTLMEVIAKDFPNIGIVTQDDLYWCDAKLDRHDLIEMLGGYAHDYGSVNEFCISNPVAIDYKQENGLLKSNDQSVKTSNTSGLKVMMFHDSFFEAVRPYIYNSVSEAKSFWIYRTSPMAYEKEILEYKPDIIVWEMLEKYTPDIMMGDIRYKKQ